MDRYERIESYLMNVMSAEDKKSFESELLIDASLKADLTSHAKMKLALNELVENDVKSVIADLEAKTNPVVLKSRRLSRKKYLTIAASLLILVCVGWWVTRSDENIGKPVSKYDVLIDTYFYPVLSNNTKGSEEANFNVELNQLIDGNKFFVEGEIDKAANNYLSLVKSANKNIKEQSEWGLIMVALKNDDNSMFDNYTQNIDSSHYFFKAFSDLIIHKNQID